MDFLNSTLSVKAKSTQSANPSVKGSKVSQPCTLKKWGVDDDSQQQLFNNIIVLLQQLLAVIQGKDQNSDLKPPPAGKTVDLTDSQAAKVKQLLGLSSTANANIVVQDTDGSGTLSAGDIATITNSIGGGERARKTLTADDIAIINGTTVVEDPSARLQSERNKWDTNPQKDNYDYTLTVSAFAPEAFKPINISVRNGEVVSATYADGNIRAPISDFYRLSVNDIFDALEEAYNRPADQVKVNYDEETGAPISSFIDGGLNNIDDEIGYQISNLNFAV